MPLLSEKDNEMIAVGASVAAGCVPCTAFHLKAAAAVGVGDDEIRRAAQEAVRVRSEATLIMARHSGLSPLEPAGPGEAPGGDRPLLLELVAVGAAYAVHCPASLRDYMAAARRAGASDDQILTAIKIACAVGEVAAEKAKSAAAIFFGADEAQAAECVCSEEDATPAATSGAKGEDEMKSANRCTCEPDNQGTACPSPKNPKSEEFE